jgi:xanthine dehydrogenase accessory factor
MKDILAELDLWQRDREEIAIATLVRLRGSAPRRPGARLCVTRGGRMAGSVSGGCVENAILDRARAVLDGGAAVLASYGIADDVAFRVGLSCGGAIDVLIEPFRPTAPWQAARHAVEHERPAVLAVALGPAALLGRQLALLEDGSTVGSIDPGLDRQVSADAQRLLPVGGTRVITVAWQGGEASVFLEGFTPPPRLFIVGATHVAVSLCRMAKELGFRVSVIDARGVFATAERFPDTDELLEEWPDRVLAERRLDARSYVVILTHDPKFDVPALALTLRSAAGYIGIIGSRKTHERRRARLRTEHGFTDAELDRIHAPIGLAIGAETPQEIALAIIAEMVAVRRRPASTHADRG